MGHERHHVIIVTSWDGLRLFNAHRFATGIFPWVSPISPLRINGYSSFFIPPDGSKESWPDSAKGDVLRQRFIDFLNAQAYYGDNVLDWIEIEYGGDDRYAVAWRNSASPHQAIVSSIPEPEDTP